MINEIENNKPAKVPALPKIDGINLTEPEMIKLLKGSDLKPEQKLLLKAVEEVIEKS